ncbi:Fe-S cluster assembly protein SufD [Rhizobium alvei]|uniref:Fe-S cluster assembly protein SufD n=1 Tax=Rhizobium alvei TaxID=1132659 RepID=A0ABT8YIS8_9HYPH|nr:Fe-S cluster assembly protein SufD [Rhizobium alvei]MDO6963145.1 Fe-S cluster assembly protein SufD [Rhizobium alvei]
MNIQTPIKPTVAETALIEAFGHAIGQLPGDAGVTARRSELVGAIKAEGLPTRRREAWHYTDLRSLLRTIPQEAATSVAALAPLVEGSTVVTLLNGKASASASISGTVVTTYASRLADGSALSGLTTYDRDDFVARLNGGFVSDGYDIAFPDGFEAEKPVEIQVVQGGGLQAGRFPVRFGADSRATVIERHVAAGDKAAIVSSVSELTLGDGAEVTWILVQTEGADDSYFGQIRVSLGKDAKLRLYLLNAGGKLVRQDIHIEVGGEGSDLMLRGINLLGGDSHTDVTLVLNHNVENTTSTEIMRNVVFDRAKGVFQGQIKVAQAAQKTDARMACNSLLLSDEAEFSAKPELEIFADDVQCGHGATVTDIDHNHLFYLASRGIPEKAGRALLVQAFVQETVEELEDEALVEALESVIQAWLDRHG